MCSLLKKTYESIEIQSIKPYVPGPRMKVLVREISALDSKSDFLLFSRSIHNITYYIIILYSHTISPVTNHLCGSPDWDHPIAVLLQMLPSV